jgi:hypothetical protein
MTKQWHGGKGVNAPIRQQVKVRRELQQDIQKQQRGKEQ